MQNKKMTPRLSLMEYEFWLRRVCQRHAALGRKLSLKEIEELYETASQVLSYPTRPATIDEIEEFAVLMKTYPVLKRETKFGNRFQNRLNRKYQNTRLRHPLAAPEISSVDSCFSIFDAAGRFLPKRIAQEEMGDTLERLAQAKAHGKGLGSVSVLIFCGIFWAYVHAFHYLVRGIYRQVFSAK